MIAVIGAGLGGLLAANLLAKEGYEVEVYERLPFPGGRFTSLNYKGFEVSTGALHMIPHGSRGPLAKLLKRIGAKVEIVDSKPEGEFLWNGERIEVRRRVFPLKAVLKFYKELAISKFKDRTLDVFANSLDDFTKAFLNSFLGWSLSIYPEDITFRKFYEIFKQTVKYRGPGIPIGGCKAVINELVENLESMGGRIYLRKEVRGMKESDGKIKLLVDDWKVFDSVVSNVGHKLTAELMGEKISHPEESRGIKYTLKLEEPFLEHTGVLFVANKNVAGMNEVTNADPNLGKGVMLQVHQPFRGEVRKAIEIGLREIREIVGKSFELIAVQSFSNDWPVNRAKAGSDLGVVFKERVVVVGDGAKGRDIEVEGIALGVEKALEELKRWT
ncbi:amine oxidase [Ferroglobus placidus DSM 10642]|uniref:Amine oxidase n=1 Tax=Ferroglobus placidus (strain DSM 10642 / AEDII12DO) TaxID=589924 RepID=D3S2J9_FERPA|nr:FAD-dependent oxidoreductase [Ferroglobus placidus]ADC64529.1 amine oxidase [Ferroglobus placidus DSM 10642]